MNSFLTKLKSFFTKQEKQPVKEEDKKYFLFLTTKDEDGGFLSHT